MTTCVRPTTLDPKREQLLVQLGEMVKNSYNSTRSSNMPTWQNLLSSSKTEIEMLISSDQQGGGPTGNRRIVNAAFLLVFSMVAVLGYLIYVGTVAGPSYGHQLLGGGCGDLAYDLVMRVTGIPLYPGCRAYHTARETMLTFVTGYRRALVADNTITMQWLVGWMTFFMSGGGLVALWNQLQGSGNSSGSNDTGNQGGSDGPSGSSGPKKDGSQGDGGDGSSGIAMGGRRKRKTRRHRTKSSKARKTHAQRKSLRR